MVSMLKTIAEALVHLLTVLLQIFVSQLEKQDVSAMMESENDPETHAQLQEMMRQLHQQKTSLEMLQTEVMQQKALSDRKGRATGATSGTISVATSSMPSTPLTQPNLTQRRVVVPSVVSQAASWEEIEELEELVVQESISVAPAPAPSAAGNPRSPPPPTLTMPLPGHLSLAEWGCNVIQFGKKHKGKKFSEVMQNDPGYLQWSLPRYHSLMPEHQDFVRYGQLWLKEIGNGL